ncbi:MAG: Uncharacterised protein [Owenweeksia sp. TMED14]|nr:MAG: Uncharacterised protein [Owenweeksia sp. TMED14]|tara:strand:- start:1702 stop:2643 length:942 start_codon:yes stop_codon:yes gene_type:complete
MKNLVTLTIILIAFTGCDPERTIVSPKKYVTDDLEVSETQQAFLLETTATWCQYCPNGAASMLEMQSTYNVSGDSNIRVIGFASHTNDALETPVQTLFSSTFTTSGIPNFYVNNVDAGQSISGPTGAAVGSTPVVGVSHKAQDNIAGDSTIVDIKVQFFQEKKNITYYVQSYLLVTGIEAREYNIGGLTVDLNQISSVPIVTTGSGNTPTKWAVDTFGKKAGDIYTHDHIPLASASTNFNWGIKLDSINPLGKSYFAGDIFGSEYTPIQLKIHKSVQGTPIPEDVNYEVVTIIWSERFDGEPGVLFVNGFQGN